MAAKRKSDPWASAEFEVADYMALKGLAAGTANEDQQKRALAWIVNTACRLNRISADPDNDRATYMNEGKRHVGLQIARLVSTPAETLKQEAKRNSDD